MKTTMRKVHRSRIFRSGDISARSKRFRVSAETIKFPVGIKVKEGDRKRGDISEW